MLLGKRLTLEAVKKLQAKGARLYDVRDPVSFRDGSLPGATSLALRNVASINKLDKKEKLIFYSATSTDVDLVMTLKYAHQFGFNNIYFVVSNTK